MSQVSNALGRRPGLVTFAAIMMFILAGFELTWAIIQIVYAIAGYSWIVTTYGTFGGYLWIWGIVDLLMAAVAFYAGVDLLRGGAFGQVVGLIIAGFSAIRWFFYLPAMPWIAVVIIAVDVIIIYGLVAHAEYFTGESDVYTQPPQVGQSDMYPRSPQLGQSDMYPQPPQAKQ